MPNISESFEGFYMHFFLFLGVVSVVRLWSRFVESKNYVLLCSNKNMEQYGEIDTDCMFWSDRLRDIPVPLKRYFSSA